MKKKFLGNTAMDSGRKTAGKIILLAVLSAALVLAGCDNGGGGGGGATLNLSGQVHTMSFDFGTESITFPQFTDGPLDVEGYPMGEGTINAAGRLSFSIGSIPDEYLEEWYENGDFDMTVTPSGALFAFLELETSDGGWLFRGDTSINMNNMTMTAVNVEYIYAAQNATIRMESFNNDYVNFAGATINLSRGWNIMRSTASVNMMTERATITVGTGVGNTRWILDDGFGDLPFAASFGQEGLRSFRAMMR